MNEMILKNPSARSAAFSRPDTTRSESLIRTNYRVLVIFRKIVKSQSSFFSFHLMIFERNERNKARRVSRELHSNTTSVAYYNK